MLKKLVNLEPYFKLQGKENLVWNKEAYEGFMNRFETEFIDRCQTCVSLSNEDRFKEQKDVGTDQSTSLLKFKEWDPIHDIISTQINQAVDSIAIDRELDLEDEDTLIEKKKLELKKWFIHNYSSELNQRMA